MRCYSKPGGIEDVGFYFSFVALSGDFFAVEQEADARGVSGFHDDLAAGADGGVRGRDQGFVGHGFAVGQDRDPGGLPGTDQEGEGSRGLGGGSSGFRG